MVAKHGVSICTRAVWMAVWMSLTNGAPVWQLHSKCLGMMMDSWAVQNFWTVLATETSAKREQVMKPSFQFEHIQKAVENQTLKLLFTKIWLFDHAELYWKLNPVQVFPSTASWSCRLPSAVKAPVYLAGHWPWCPNRMVPPALPHARYESVWVSQDVSRTNRSEDVCMGVDAHFESFWHSKGLVGICLTENGWTWACTTAACNSACSSHMALERLLRSIYEST